MEIKLCRAESFAAQAAGQKWYVSCEMAVPLVSATGVNDNLASFGNHTIILMLELDEAGKPK